jgi:threonine dehydrogenase-like Zn-dependent dehydrogenase
VRVEDVPDPVLREPTDAVVRVPRSCVCGSDLWPYAAREHTEHGDRMGTSSSGSWRTSARRCRG